VIPILGPMTKTPPFRKVLVANRGEIALRVFRTCAEQGIATVAIYSDADRHALHVARADEAVYVGGAAAGESYLNVERILAAARETGAEAIHPGYGFLSERAAFVEACEAAGIVFIGPGVHAMEVMGDKVRARQAMQAAGVPVVPGVNDLDTADDALAAARTIGLPVMLKASAGGGGKGMRVVEREADLRRAFEGARREAIAAFGDGRMLLERAVLRARHVEIQVMADKHGAVVSLGERDCSVQRRHQKVIEEAPSPSPQMNPTVRAAMGEVAVRAARAVAYSGAGTVEFLFEETAEGPRFYFLEMNTRLQVEHPVTELTCGRDLVLDQLRVAAGEPLGYGQADVRQDGHAIECRLYAEDPIRFLPSPGPVRCARWPVGAHIRVDTAVESGSEVSSYYDPMIAKLSVWGEDRPAALRRMREALRLTVILGIATNLDFHRRALAEDDFNAGHFSTRYIDEHPDLLAVADESVDDATSAAIAAAAAYRAAASLGALDPGCADPSPVPSSWRQSVRWRR
jgi:acetyl-CoA carboxylase biotin carboxylase subunit